MSTFTWNDKKEMKEWREKILSLGLKVPEEMSDVEEYLMAPTWYVSQRKWSGKPPRRYAK